MRKLLVIESVIFWILATISFVSIIFLLSIDDVYDEGMFFYSILCTVVVISTTSSILFYNYRVVVRHIFAVKSLITLIYIAYRNVHSRRYNYLYDAALKTKSVSRFYNAMLRLYDVANKDIITVSDLYN